MRFIVDEEPTDPKKCPFYTQEVDSKNLAKLIFCDDKPIFETLDICHFEQGRSRYCRLRDGDSDKCPYLISYRDFINEQNKQCSAQMEAHAHDT